MARVTVEDCVEKVPNRFELVMLASQRARKIGSGAALLVARDNDKNPVVSLREIAEDKVDPEVLKEELIRTNQRIIEMDDSEDVIDSGQNEEEWSNMVARATAYNDGEMAGADDDDFDDEGEASLEDIAGGAPDEDDE